MKVPNIFIFLFAHPSNWILEFEIRIFLKKCSSINQKTPPTFAKATVGNKPPKTGINLGVQYSYIIVGTALTTYNIMNGPKEKVATFTAEFNPPYLRGLL